MLPPGTVLKGKFLIGYSIGFGGFGITYIGWDQVLQRKVAIKEFYPRQITERNQDGVTFVWNRHSIHWKQCLFGLSLFG